MKLSSTLFIGAFALSVAGALAQTTPNCASLSDYIVTLPPLTPTQIATMNSDQQSQYPNVVKLEEPTSSYNCHNYAW